MGISVSLVLIAIGAILTWAVTATASGVDLNVVGVILMVVGGVGLDPLDDLLVELGRFRWPLDLDGRARPCRRSRGLIDVRPVRSDAGSSGRVAAGRVRAARWSARLKGRAGHRAWPPCDTVTDEGCPITG